MMHSDLSLLITGGAGFIGSMFVTQCVARGIRPVVLDKLTYAGHAANLAHLPSGGYHLIQGDIADGALVGKLLREHKVQAVINFAAESHVDNSILGPKPFIDTNIVGVYQLLQATLEYFRVLPAMSKEAFRFVQISTDEVYGALGAEGAFSEESPYRPNSPYSASKAAGDHLVRAWHHTFDLPVITTHCTNNYGPRQYPEKLIPHMIACALAGKHLPIYGDGKYVRDWIHVEDHCAGVWLAFERGKPGETYDFGGRAEVENLTLVKTLCELLDAKRPRVDGKSYSAQIAFVKDRPGHDRRYAIDDSKAERELEFTRKHNVESGLAETIEWYLLNQNWCETVTKKAA